jgi:hypothetical protein
LEIFAFCGLHRHEVNFLQAADLPWRSCNRSKEASNMAETSQNFMDALLAGERHPDIPEEHDLYGWLVGAWNSVIYDLVDAPEGQPRISRGEWIFSRTLEGRAIQDIFIVPSREARSRGDWGTANVRYGIAHRQYDPAIRAWHIDFFTPATGAHTQLIGRRDGDAIRQVSIAGEDPSYHWDFVDIEADRFTWQGRKQNEKGEWVLSTEFKLTRAISKAGDASNSRPAAARLGAFQRTTPA